MRKIFSLSIAILILTWLASCAPKGTTEFKNAIPEKVNDVIYGNDDRLDYADVDDQGLREMARSTVALINTQNMIYDSVFDKYNLENEDLGLNMCSTEKFRGQPLWANCSGSLIGTDLILTAGHCVRDVKGCQNTKFVFDYTELEKKMTLDSVSAANVFACKEIVYSTENKNAADFAIIRLDRDVMGRASIGFSDRPVTYQDQVMMVGHPAGMPTKFTLNGKVRNLLPESFFTISIDAYTGNSGSAVFDQQTRKIVGVLVRGENDYKRENGCYVSKHCAEDECRGEDVTRASEIIKYLPKP